LERTLETTAWAREHQNWLIGATIVVALLVGALLYLRYSSQRLAEGAAIQLFQLRATAGSGNPALTIRDGEEFLRRFGRTPSATEARLVLGQAYLDAQQPDRTVETVQSLANSDMSNPAAVTASFLLAAAHEAATRYDQAEAAYLRIADRARFDFQKTAALDAAASLHMERSEYADAVALYDRLLKELPENSPDRSIYEMRRGEAAAAAGTART
jgi:tetratricopeptide (TPR) repeat protein